jgi:hypothetical protein
MRGLGYIYRLFFCLFIFLLHIHLNLLPTHASTLDGFSVIIYANFLHQVSSSSENVPFVSTGVSQILALD